MLKQQHSLKSENTFGIEVKAKYFAEIHNPAQLKEILSKVPKGTPVLPLGSGSNILFTKDFEGLVIKDLIGGIEILHETEGTVLIYAGAGVIWHDLVRFCVERNYSGIENLSLIPGTCGAAPIQNIGAYGMELKDVLKSVDFIRLDDLQGYTYSNAECDFGYRDSIFKHDLKGLVFITGITLELKKEAVLNTSYSALSSWFQEHNIQPKTVRDISDAVIAIRRSKLPDPAELGNAGSFFKNPEIPSAQYEQLKQEYPAIPAYPVAEGIVKVPAGWLIEQCGWKGKVCGNTGSHAKQALVIVNYGSASGNEIKEHAYNVINSVRQKFGIQLQPEVNII